ncbi:alpha/beta hydrolase [Mongoliibacter ruber]|uniref:Putative esterase n=1 Tax=Mongoliibacter ruber TaxID=1750599 RepID=A0A2T0WIR3_9BACT|nr:alpha/beta hydrolase [Mongoliibacter ruber]PRY86601.1 putative esterase [Mongoliibacter ruber]
MKGSIKFTYNAHYRISHVVNREENEIIIALHGYGQLAEFFLRKLTPLFMEERVFVVPEATNYSYLEGFSGRVGANWMTRHERETAIANNHMYLNELLRAFLIKYQTPPKIKVLGFSQGAATATRWVSQLEEKVDTLILWGGGFAHDLVLEKTKSSLDQTKTYVVLGTNDDFITPETIQKQEEIIADLKLNVEKRFYDGGHDLNLPLLKELLDA